MATEFGYETDTPADAVLSVADAIRASHRLAPLTDEQKLQRRIDQETWREQQAWQTEQRRIERERLETQHAEAERAEAALALAEANKARRLEQQQRDRERQRVGEILDLRLQTAQHRGWMINAENAARTAVAVRQRQALITDIESHFNPPPPPEEASVVVADDRLGSPNYFDDNYNPNYYHDKFWGKSAK